MLPFESIYIKHFRGLKNREISECRAVNILVGDNNSGKTSVLEAILVLCSPFEHSQWLAATEIRGTWPLTDSRFATAPLDRLDSLKWLFPYHQGEVAALHLKASGTVPTKELIVERGPIYGQPPSKTTIGPHEAIEGAYHGAGANWQNGLELSFHYETSEVSLSTAERQFRMVFWEHEGGPNGHKNGSTNGIDTVFATPISHRSDGYLTARVGRLIRTKLKQRAIELLQELDDNIIDLVIVTPEKSEDDSIPFPRPGPAPTLHVEDRRTGLIPVHAVGDGLRRAIHFAVLLADLTKGGVLLIDELEVGLHTSVLKPVFRWLTQACKREGVQLFATTHSLEAVDALLTAEPENDLALFRLNVDKVRKYDRELLRTSRLELGLEIR